MPGPDGFKVALASGQGGHIGEQNVAPGDAVSPLGEGSREGSPKIRVPLYQVAE